MLYGIGFDSAGNMPYAIALYSALNYLNLLFLHVKICSLNLDFFDLDKPIVASVIIEYKLFILLCCGISSVFFVYLKKKCFLLLLSFIFSFFLPFFIIPTHLFILFRIFSVLSANFL